MDRDIAAQISAALHEPFRTLWRGYEKDAWQPVVRALKQALASHEGALKELANGAEADPAEAPESAWPGHPGAGETADARYLQRTASEVLDPIRAVLRDAGHAVALESALAGIASQVARAVEGLPTLVTAPISPWALDRQAGMGLWPGVKRGLARALRPIAWKREAHDVAVAEVASGYLGRVVLPVQMRAFRDSQRSRAAWLGGLERTWSKWLSAVLGSPEGGGGGGGVSCLDAAKRLDLELRALPASDSSPWGQRAGPEAERSEAILLATVAVAGTFAEIGTDGDTAPRRDEEAAADWDRWAAQSAARLDLCAALLEARRGVDGIRRKMIAKWAGAVQEIDAALSEVEACLDRGRARAERLAGKVAGLVEALQREEVRTVDEIGQVEGALPGPGRLLETLTDDTEAALRHLEVAGDHMPEALVVHRVPRADARMRRAGGAGHAVELREAALQAFDARRAQRIRAAPAVVAEAMGRVHTMVAELREVSAYGYAAAIAELTEATDPAAVQPVEMVTNGLSRAARKVEVARGVLLDSLAAARTGANLEVAQGMEHLVQRATADRLAARYLDARSHVVAEAARDQQRWRGRLSRAARRVSAAWRILRTRLWPVKRALGIGADLRSQAELRDRTLAFAEEVPARLPVVYRRLFAFEPLTDSRLLAGREDALDAVASAWGRWQAERTRSLMVVAPPGSGVTSFLNIVVDRLRAEAPRAVRQILRDRVRTEAALADRLGRWLGLGGAPDLDGLAARILETPPSSLPRLVILEGAQHLHLRVPEGALLLERFLAFATRTQPQVFWVLSMTSSAWQLARKRCPASFADLERIELAGLSASELKQAVMSRHRLSGLPLEYVEPRTGRNLLLGRTRGARGSHKHQQQIEADYFQRLHRTSLGSIRLALFHWLRSADFRTVEGSLQVQPLEPLQPFAGALDIDQSFALKAILDHGTLTAAEYCEVVRIPLPQGRHLFHALCDLRVIEPAPGGPGTPGNAETPGYAETPDNAETPGYAGTPGTPEAPGSSNHPEPRYRVRPLVSGAVVAHLKSLNIVH